MANSDPPFVARVRLDDGKWYPIVPVANGDRYGIVRLTTDNSGNSGDIDDGYALAPGTQFKINWIDHY